jgi:hypothetical protein
MSNGIGYECMNVMRKELLFNMPMDFQLLKQRCLKEDMFAMFFQANVNRSFTQMFQVKGIGHFLLDMIQEEGQLSILIYKKKEEDDLTDQTELKDHRGSTDEEDGEDHDLGVGDNFAIIDDDVDEHMLENDIDDDDDIINPFNIVS